MTLQSVALPLVPHSVRWQVLQLDQQRDMWGQARQYQQGVQGAAEHVSHPNQIAWQSMCATDEGRQKGEKWCKRAIWGNTLPKIKHIWKSVDNLTSGAFVKMWQDRVHHFFTRYSEAATK